jgi:peptidoglycan biosynthesis protein MviN/MurJ (putative lipid II flippase)
LRQILFFIIPISLLMFVLRAQIVRVILGSGQFVWSATRLTASGLGFIFFKLFAQALVP